PDRLEVHGTPSQALEQVAYDSTYGSAQFDFSQSGTLVYRTGGAGSRLVTVQLLESTGKMQPMLARPGLYSAPSLSPDGQRVALTASEGGNDDIWVYDSQRDTMIRVTFGPEPSMYPLWSPDGKYILFQSPGGMYWVRSDGSGKPQQLTQSKNVQYPWSFTADGKTLAFIELSP